MICILQGEVNVDRVQLGQEDPPFLAVGLLQALYLYFIPVPVLHEPHEPQVPQLP